ncbi:hypothetical protein HDV00_000465 [Rhizophlyctis rosea]|nr:hypothetical protein HDV00_000465 [Rhizophlyctis rosea]
MQPPKKKQPTLTGFLAKGTGRPTTPSSNTSEPSISILHKSSPARLNVEVDLTETSRSTTTGGSRPRPRYQNEDDDISGEIWGGSEAGSDYAESTSDTRKRPAATSLATSGNKDPKRFRAGLKATLASDSPTSKSPKPSPKSARSKPANPPLRPTTTSTLQPKGKRPAPKKRKSGEQTLASIMAGYDSNSEDNAGNDEDDVPTPGTKTPLTESSESSKSSSSNGKTAKSAPSRPVSSNQSSLHNFLGLPDYRVPGYFYYDDRKNVATFTSEKPLQIAWKSEFHWRDQHRTITICSSVPSAELNTLHLAFVHHNGPPYTSAFIPLLKSHLQKCIRRGKPTVALRTAKHLALLDINQLLRRVPIMVVEDAVLHIKFPILIWLMCALSKGFHPPESCVKWLLGFVEALASSTFRDPVPNSDETPPDESQPVKLNSKEVSSLPTEYRDLLYSLQLRKAYGGMRGDMAMLDAATTVWFKRFLPDPSSPPPSLFQNPFYTQMNYQINTIQLEQTADLDIREWELSAVDFHCTDIVDQLRWELMDEDQDTPEEEIKRVIWEKSSSVTNKRLLKGDQDGGNKGRMTKSAMSRDRTEVFWGTYSNTIRDLAKGILKSMWKQATEGKTAGDDD